MQQEIHIRKQTLASLTDKGEFVYDKPITYCGESQNSVKSIGSEDMMDWIKYWKKEEQ